MQDLAYLSVLGKPLVFYIGALSVLAILTAASVPGLFKRGIRIIHIRHHPKVAAFALAVSALHVVLAVGSYF